MTYVEMYERREEMEATMERREMTSSEWAEYHATVRAVDEMDRMAE